jgi:1,4-dihydroxy-2-naphthoate octaprenyltransferase
MLEGGADMVFKVLIKAIKPFRLLSLIAMYLLGTGLVQYVQSLRDWSGFFEGLLFLIFISTGVELVRLHTKLNAVNQWPDGISFKEVRFTRWMILVLAATLVTTATAIFINWQITGEIWMGLVVLVVSLLVLSGLYYLCGNWTELRPYQVLIEAMVYIVLPPAFAYFIQSSHVHLFLTLSVIGFVPAFIAFRILVQIQQFPADLKHDNQTLVTRIGWEKAMVVHNTLVLLTFLVFALIVFLGLPWFILWPVFLVLPIGLMEVWLMERVRRGGKPYWLVMIIASACIQFIPIYLLGFAFWIR